MPVSLRHKAIRLGCRDQCTQHGVAVFFDLRARQLVNRLQRLLRRRRLLPLPGLIRLERHHPQRRQRRVVSAAGAPLRRRTG